MPVSVRLHSKSGQIKQNYPPTISVLPSSWNAHTVLMCSMTEISLDYPQNFGFRTGKYQGDMFHVSQR